MRTILTIAFCLVMLQLTAGPGDAVMYKWVDPNGVVHFSDTPPPSDQEPETRETTIYKAPEPAPAQLKRQKASPSTSRKVESKKAAVRSRPKVGDNKVEIFTADWCGYCKKAIALLKANNIPFKQHDIEKDTGARKRMESLGGRGGVPFAIINGEKIHGFSVGTYNRVLGLSQ